MSDEPGKTVVSFGADPGQEQTGVIEGDAATEEGQEPITREQLEAELKKVQEQAFRQAQSLVDKGDNRVSKEVRERFQALEDRRAEMTAAGQPVSDEAFARLLEDERLKILASTDGMAAQPGDGEDTEALIEDTNRKAQEIWKEVGVTIEKDDPEAEQLDFTTPEIFLTTARAAAIVKANRLKQEDGEPAETPNQIAARIAALGGSGGQSNPIANITDPATLIKMGLEGRKR